VYKACTAGLYLPKIGIVGGSPTWGVGVHGTAVFVSRCVRTGLATNPSLRSVPPNVCKQDSQTRKTEDTELRRPLTSYRCNYGLKKISTLSYGSSSLLCLYKLYKREHFNWINQLSNTTIWWLDICCLLRRYQLRVSALVVIFRLID